MNTFVNNKDIQYYASIKLTFILCEIICISLMTTADKHKIISRVVHTNWQSHFPRSPAGCTLHASL